MTVVRQYKTIRDVDTIDAFYITTGIFFNDERMHRHFFDACNEVYLRRRPRKVLSWNLHRRLLREIGHCIEGDYCRVPDFYIVKDDLFVERLQRIHGFFLDYNVVVKRRPHYKNNNVRRMMFIYKHNGRLE